MPAAADAARRLDALLQVALRLARQAPTGRVALAQVAQAIEPDWMPRPWGDPIIGELDEAVRQACEPVPLPAIERTLRDAWGVAPREELDELEPDPVLVTPVAQVHRGVLEGRPVAVKVLRPGLATAVRQDLILLESLAGPIGAAFPAIEPAALLAEVRERVLDDLDLEHQATVQRRFHRALRAHPLFLVPAPVTRLAHDAVLVSEWVEGTPLPQASDRDGAAARLVLFAAGSLRWGTAHADLDPREVLELEDGRIAVVDFGATRTVEPGRAELTALVVSAFADEDGQALARHVAELGWLPPDQVADAEELIRHALGELGTPGPARLDSNAVIAARDRMLERPRQLLRMLLAGSLAPEDLWPARGAGQLFSTIARVGATGPWLELLRAGLERGWETRLPR